MEQFGIGNGAEFQSQNRVIESPGYSGFQITTADDKADAYSTGPDKQRT